LEIAGCGRAGRTLDVYDVKKKSMRATLAMLSAMLCRYSLPHNLPPDLAAM